MTLGVMALALAAVPLAIAALVLVIASITSPRSAPVIFVRHALADLVGFRNGRAGLALGHEIVGRGRRGDGCRHGERNSGDTNAGPDNAHCRILVIAGFGSDAARADPAHEGEQAQAGKADRREEMSSRCLRNRDAYFVFERSDWVIRTV